MKQNAQGHTTDKEIVAQIIALRKRRGMTQAELARRAGLSPSSISRLERRGHFRELDLLRRIADVFGARLVVRFVPRRDPDAGLEVRPEVIADLLRQEKEYAAGKRGKSLAQVKREFGLA
jgi:transcriptional regulator with XRE-family HTH domain